MKDDSHPFFTRILPALLYLLLMFSVSSIPSLTPPRIGFSWDDKIYHFIEYAGLAFFLFRATGYWMRSGSLTVRSGLAFAAGAIAGAADELLQLLVPKRACQVEDWAADVAGLLAMLVIVVIVRLYVHRRR
jgi:VanZ family protein